MCFLMLVISVNAIAQINFDWASSTSGAGDEITKSVVTDNAGNVYVAGTFTGSSIMFGSIQLSNSSTTGSAFFIAKYDSAGTALWAKTANGLLNRDGLSIDIDQAGNIYVVGHFESAILNFGAVSLSNPSSPSTDIFLAKYDNNGNFIWARSGKGNGYEYTRNVKTDGFGNVYVNGWYSSDTFVYAGLTIINGGNPGTDHSFMAKFDSNGTIIWMQTSYQGNNSDYATALTTDSNGNTYLGGFFSSDTIRYGAYTIVNSSPGYFDLFVAKIDSMGNVLWLSNAGGADNESLNSIAVDASGNVLITGSFYSSSLPFGSVTLTNSDVTNSTTDIYLTKLNSSGNVVWSKQALGADNDESKSVTVDSNDDIYITGYYHSNSMSCGTNTVLNSSGVFYSDLFIAKYHSNGTEDWLIKTGGTNSDKANAIFVSNTGNTFIAGAYESSNMAFGANTLLNTGGVDAFLVKTGLTVGVQEYNVNSYIQVYPIPANDYVTVSEPNNKVITRLEVYDNIGQIVSDIKLENTNFKINISALKNGLYFIKAYADNEFLSGSKVVIEK